MEEHRILPIFKVKIHWTVCRSFFAASRYMCSTRNIVNHHQYYPQNFNLYNIDIYHHNHDYYFLASSTSSSSPACTTWLTMTTNTATATMVLSVATAQAKTTTTRPAVISKLLRRGAEVSWGKQNPSETRKMQMSSIELWLGGK